VALANRGNLPAGPAGQAGRIADIRKAQGLLQRLASEFPDEPDYRDELANTCNTLAAVLFAADRPAARLAMHKARDLFARLAADHPDVPRYQGDLGMTLGNLGYLHLRQGDLGAARACLEQGLGRLRAALAANPDSPAYLGALRRHQRSLAWVLVHQGDHAGADRYAATLDRALPGQGRGAFLAACFLARGAVLIERGVVDSAAETWARPRLNWADASLALRVARSTPPGPLARPDAQAVRHAVAAVGLLGKARQANFRQAQQWHNDPDLRPLLARQVYRELL